MAEAEPKACPDQPAGNRKERIDSWSAENHDPKDGAAEFEAIGPNIASFQRFPDASGLSEIGDDDGIWNNG